MYLLETCGGSLKQDNTRSFCDWEKLPAVLLRVTSISLSHDRPLPRLSAFCHIICFPVMHFHIVCIYNVISECDTPVRSMQCVKITNCKSVLPITINIVQPDHGASLFLPYQRRHHPSITKRISIYSCITFFPLFHGS